MVSFRVLSRTNLAYRSHRSSPKSRPFNLLQPLASLFAPPVLCFQQLAASFPKTPRVGVSPHLRAELRFRISKRARFSKGCKDTETAILTTFRINTCKSVSKQRTLTPFRINTYKKTGGGGPRFPFPLPTTHYTLLTFSRPSHAPRGASIPHALTRLRILPVTTGVYYPLQPRNPLCALCACPSGKRASVANQDFYSPFVFRRSVGGRLAANSRGHQAPTVTGNCPIFLRAHDEDANG